MQAATVTFRTGAVHPVAALSEAWGLLAGHYWLFLGVTLLGMVIGGAAPLGILMGPMMCGIYLCYLRRMRGEKVELPMLFEGFTCFVESMIVGVVVTVLMLVVLLPCILVPFFALGVAAGLSSGERGGCGLSAGLIVALALVVVFLFAFVLLVALFTSFAYPLVIDHRLKAMDALQTSFKAAMANFAGLVGLFLLTGAIGLVAAMLCYVPALLVMPLTFGMLAVAYRQVFPDEGAAPA